jgi:hypothetical protein
MGTGEFFTTEHLSTSLRAGVEHREKLWQPGHRFLGITTHWNIIVGALVKITAL